MHQYFLLKFKRETEMERKKAIQTLSNRRRDKVKGRLAKKGRAGLVKFGQKSIRIVLYALRVRKMDIGEVDREEWTEEAADVAGEDDPACRICITVSL